MKLKLKSLISNYDLVHNNLGKYIGLKKPIKLWPENKLELYYSIYFSLLKNKKLLSNTIFFMKKNQKIY